MGAQKIFTEGWNDYELIDAGGEKKLERWGNIVTIRPERQAYFRSEKPFTEWNRMAHWEFVPKGSTSGTWKCLKPGTKNNWQIQYDGFTFNLQLTKFKHLGIFPEQRINWDFIKGQLNENDAFLNLFAYTGAASIAGRSTGADVFHVDSVKQLITWGKDNMKASGLDNIKWVHEDALKFASREVKRNHKYKGIIMDPPAWGIGAKKEKWKLEDQLDFLLSNAAKLLTPDGFLILNTYSPKVDINMLKELGQLYLGKRDTTVSELWMKTTTGKDLYFGNLLRSL